MLFDDGDTTLLKKWIVKRLEDISDADSDVLADYVLALLRHEQGTAEVKKLCVDQLDDFLREHTKKFVSDVFAALSTKSFLSVNATLTGGGLSVSMPDLPKPPLAAETAPGPMAIDEDDVKLAPLPPQQQQHGSGRKRGYFDRDAIGFNDDTQYGPSSGNGRGMKAPRRGRGSGNEHGGRGGRSRDANLFPGAAGTPPMFGLPTPPHPPPPGAFRWAPPDPNDPMTQMIAAQMAVAASAWGAPFGSDVGAKKVVKKVGKRCRDYDEKGFCMKGDMCPYEHGVNHIVVGRDTKDAEYDPNNSTIFPSPATEKPPRGSSGGRGGDRGRGGTTRGDRGDRGGGRGGRGSGKGGRGGRSDFSATGPSFDKSNAKLVIENIPHDKLTETSVREFFGKFGIVASVEIHQPNSCAVLKFDKWDMAKAAYDSPAPIFDNRFVKVFWHKPGVTDSHNNPHSHHDAATALPKSRKFLTEPNATAPSTSEPQEEKELDIEEVKKKQEELQRLHEEKMAKKKANEEATRNLEKMKADLMARQAEEKKKLLAKLEKKHMPTTPTPLLAGGSNTVDSTPTPDSASPPPPVDPAKAKADATTAALKAQLEALEAEAQAMGIDPNAMDDDTFNLNGFRGRGRGRGRFATRARGGAPPWAARGRSGFDPGSRGGRGRGRGAPTMKLDNRTKRVAITAPELRGDREEEFRHYLINNGIELEAIEPHPDKDDTQILTFQDRRNAEKFVHSGKDIPSLGSVSLAWYNAPITSTHRSTPTPTPKPQPQTATTTVNYYGDTRMDGGASTGDDVADLDEMYDLADEDERRWYHRND